MATITIVEHISLDGVVQAPGAPEEDRRGDFRHGGWFGPYFDADLGEVMGRGMQGEGGMLFGRRTYESLRDAWAGTTDNPFGPVLDARPKFVVSRDAGYRPSWVNSTLVSGDAATSVAELKASTDLDLTVLGSPELLTTLLPAGLVDELWLTVAPLVLGSGHRLFAGLDLHRLELRESLSTSTGVVVCRYRWVG